MKELINSIIKDSQLKAIECSFYEFETLFAYFEDKEDFFIFLFCTHSELTQKIHKLNNNDTEYALNLFVHEFKQSKLEEFKHRNIDNNLSLILVLDLKDMNLPYLHKIEENSIISKKYILSYNSNDLSRLKEEVDQKSNTINSLNELAIKYSYLLQNDDEKWYKLLLRLFIKIPFLNYITVNQNEELKKIENLENSIFDKLSTVQQSVLNKIIDDFDTNNTDIESFVISNFVNHEKS